MNTLVAVDVSKSSLQVQTESRGWEVSNDLKGLGSLTRSISKEESPFVIFEATGGYERLLMRYLQERDIAVCRVNPRRVRAFAVSEGVKAKTDPIDAQVLLHFAKEKRLEPTVPATAEHEALKDFLDRRSHLSEFIAREKNRLQNSSERIHPSIRRVLKTLEQELKKIEQSICDLVEKNPVLKAQVAKLTAIKGVGKVTAWTVLGYLGEIDRIKRNEAVALAGLAPFNKDSGKFKGKRKIDGGRAKVRKTLYMATRTAATHNPVIKPYFDRLEARGKPYKCAMVAAMRKLLLHMRSELINLQLELAV